MIYISSYIIVQMAKISEEKNNQINLLKTAQNQGKHDIDKNLARGKMRKKTSIPKDPAPNKKIQQLKSKQYEPPNHPSLAGKKSKKEHDANETQNIYVLEKALLLFKKMLEKQKFIITNEEATKESNKVYQEEPKYKPGSYPTEELRAALYNIEEIQGDKCSPNKGKQSFRVNK